MIRMFASVVALILVCTVSAFPGDLTPKALPAEAPEIPADPGYRPVSDVYVAPPLDVTVVGTPTTLTGFYDWQSNGGQQVKVLVNPANGNIHVTYQASSDSLNIGSSRVTRYAFSTDGGGTWNNFNNIQIPGGRSSGYPCLALGYGAIAGGVILANHSNPGAGNQTFVYVDVPEGSGVFAELGALPQYTGLTEQPIWPGVTGATDGSVVLHSSPNNSTTPTNLFTRTADYTTWSTWAPHPGTNSIGGRYPVHSTGTGRVGSLLQAVANGTFWLESTNNGASWQATSTTIHAAAADGGRVAGVDTFQAWVGADFLYNGDTPLMVIDELGIGANDPTDAGYISFYSQATGWVEIARPQTTPGAILYRSLAQSNHFTMGWPSIGMSGSNLVVAWTVMQADTSAAHFNFCDIYVSKSSNGGQTWTSPYNLTQTPNMDERYPSVAKWNEPGFANIVWQLDTEPGSHAFTDNAPLSRTWQMFHKLDLSTLTGTPENETLVTGFKLSQNYPNPFNPATKITYTVDRSGPVSIKVYNMLGQEVATLVDRNLPVGSYEVTFDGSSLPSGVYVYRMQSIAGMGQGGSFVDSRKMVLVK